MNSPSNGASLSTAKGKLLLFSAMALLSFYAATLSAAPPEPPTEPAPTHLPTPPPEVSPIVSEDISDWDDWVFYSLDRPEGFSLSGTFALGFSTLEGLSGTRSSEDFISFSFPMRGLYTLPWVPWLQAQWTLSPSLGTYTRDLSSYLPFTLLTGPGLQMRFLRFSFLSPFFLSGELPLGYAAVFGPGDISSFVWGYRISGGMELAFQDTQSMGLRISYEWLEYPQNNSSTQSTVSFGFEYRRYTDWL